MWSFCIHENDPHGNLNGSKNMHPKDNEHYTNIDSVFFVEVVASPWRRPSGECVRRYGWGDDPKESLQNRIFTQLFADTVLETLY